MEKLLRLSCHS